MKNNKGLFLKKRFESQEADKVKYLTGLSERKSIEMLERLVCLANELRKNFFPDNPLSLKISLRKSAKS